MCLTVILASSIPARSQTAPTPPKAIAVGDVAPKFSLKDQNDASFTLDEMVKQGPVAMVFVRSVEWCTYCQLQTIQLATNLKEIEANGGQVVIITYDAPEKIKRFAGRRKLQIPILSDADSKIIDAYAMRAVQLVSGDQIGSAQHGTFVIDRQGLVRSKPYLKSFEDRTAIDTLAAALKEAGGTNPKLN